MADGVRNNPSGTNEPSVTLDEVIVTEALAQRPIWIPDQSGEIATMRIIAFAADRTNGETGRAQLQVAR